MGTDSDRAAFSQLLQLKQRKQEQWKVAVNSIDFSHFSCKPWSTINILAGLDALLVCAHLRKLHHFALVKNEAHKTGSCESSRLTNLELSDLQKIPTPEENSIFADAWSQVRLHVWTLSSKSLCSIPGRLSNLGVVISSLPTLCQFQGSGEEH